VAVVLGRTFSYCSSGGVVAPGTSQHGDSGRRIWSLHGSRWSYGCDVRLRDSDPALSVACGPGAGPSERWPRSCATSARSGLIAFLAEADLVPIADVRSGRRGHLHVPRLFEMTVHPSDLTRSTASPAPPASWTLPPPTWWLKRLLTPCPGYPAAAVAAAGVGAHEPDRDGPGIIFSRTASASTAWSSRYSSSAVCVPRPRPSDQLESRTMTGCLVRQVLPQFAGRVAPAVEHPAR
jgi:hypothetical protein